MDNVIRIDGELKHFGQVQAMRLLLGKSKRDKVSLIPIEFKAEYVKRVLLSATLLFAGCYHKTTFQLPIPPGLVEAPTGFQNPPQTNGTESQADMDLDRAQFEQLQTTPQLGPHFNNVACVACHSNPMTGGDSAVFEHRIGPDEPGDNVASATLIHAGSVPPVLQQTAPLDATNALRRTLPLEGDGYVEAIDDSLLLYIASRNGGQAVSVPVLEAAGTSKIGRFGWKDQEATLLSFAADADFNEMGICNRFLPSPLNAFDCDGSQIEDGETPPPDSPNKVEDIDFYASFMRALQAPPVHDQSQQSAHGAAVFEKVGCHWCHLSTLYTHPIQIVPPVAGGVRYQFHPFSDFLLHDIGTGDGIMQGPAPANKVKTAPLWGVSHRERFLHDGRAFTTLDAIEAHKKEANFSRKKFNHLNQDDQRALLAFLNTL